MKRAVVLLLALVPIFGACTLPTSAPVAPEPEPMSTVNVKLPAPVMKSQVSLEETLSRRRSVREYTGKSLTLQEVSQLLWAAQGVTSRSGGRTAPSAGALYPLEIYLVAGGVENLDAGVYRYQPEKHELATVKNTDVRKDLAEAALQQTSISDGAIDIVIAAVYERTTVKYGERGIRYVHMEAGHAAQNVALQSTALELGTVTIGAFYDERVKAVLGMEQDETPLYIMPVGRK